MQRSLSIPVEPFTETELDHRACVEAAVAGAARVCRARGARLTALRRRVLEIVWRSHEPVGAYAILEALRRRGRPAAAPPTVYRALGFLADHGLVHRIESLNAYVGCAHPGEAHGGQFLICRRCGRAAEVDDRGIRTALTRSARDFGFRIQSQTVEALGLCPVCAGAESAP